MNRLHTNIAEANHTDCRDDSYKYGDDTYSHGEIFYTLLNSICALYWQYRLYIYPESAQMYSICSLISDI